MNRYAAKEGVQIAIDALRSNKVRAFLTILGIAIGVATVTGMASIISGVQSGITSELESIGPDNFVISRFDQSKPQFSGRPWEGKPPLTLEEADVVSELGSVGSVTPVLSASGAIRFDGKTFEGASIMGLGQAWPTYVRGDFVNGRNFLPVEVLRSAPVGVVSEDFATLVFGDVRDPVGRTIRVGSAPVRIVGVYKPKPDLFGGGPQQWIYLPTTTAAKYLRTNQNWMEFWVVPAVGSTQDRAMDDVTVSLRAMRGLRPGDENDFALVRQEAFAEMINGITSVIYLVMMVLSSIGLMVGGVGVVAIMMISVTERTREIGVRKALGATRREILWQFLVEAMTVTVIGGAIGMLLGAGGALALAAATPIPATIPLWSVAAALLMSAITGIAFGLYPANKAARLDPVEALRYE